MRKHATIFWVLALWAGWTHAEIVTLRGGAVIDAPLLKRDNDQIVVDIGHSAITIPMAQVLDIRKHDSDANTTLSDTAADQIYSTKPLKRATTEKAARTFSPAVILVRSPGGLGSGFFVNDEGYLITNFHVIRGEKRISVTRFERKGPVLNRIIYDDVEIVATDPFHDLAVLKVTPKNKNDIFTSVVLSANKKATFGESVFVIGNPLGLERSITKGVLSQVARNFSGSLYLQVDASVNPGNSGGPLFNERGQVIGVINMGVPAMQGLNFAIPIRHVKFLLENLDAYTYDQSNPESGFVYPDPPPRFMKTNKE
ncbi:MAG: serine protease Do [Candidatus Promineifilaceae bacterium]|jgi:serine protease Do